MTALCGALFVLDILLTFGNRSDAGSVDDFLESSPSDCTQAHGAWFRISIQAKILPCCQNLLRSHSFLVQDIGAVLNCSDFAVLRGIACRSDAVGDGTNQLVRCCVDDGCTKRSLRARMRDRWVIDGRVGESHPILSIASRYRVDRQARLELWMESFLVCPRLGRQ